MYRNPIHQFIVIICRLFPIILPMYPISIVTRSFSVLIVLCFTVLTCELAPPTVTPAGQSTVQLIRDMVSVTDSLELQEAVDSVWSNLQALNQIPVVRDSSATFFYKGTAESVSWNGDFNQWGGNPAFDNKGTLIDGTDIWYLEAEFPPDARLDYKIVVDGSWMLDPANPAIQRSGHGPNSELAMPEYIKELWTLPAPETARGRLENTKIIHSRNLGYDIEFRVYLPAEIHTKDPLPVLYITDGDEYLDPGLGALTYVADNLIQRGLIEPVILVFVSPIAPDDSTLNRRAEELALSQIYLRFYTEELIPYIDRKYKTKTGAENRAILGTSLGGLNATYFAFSRPDFFGSAAIQSPAYWYREKIYDIVEEYQGSEPVLFLSTGTIGDGTLDARRMHALLTRKGYTPRYMEVPEGHSWGAWRTQTDDILRHLFGR